MVLATISKPKQLLHISYFGHVSAEELQRGRADIAALLSDLKSGFRLMADLSQLEKMDINCAPELGKTMELCDQHGVALIVRIIPDPRKDIGLNILSLFRYHHHPRIVTCKTLVEAGEILALDGRET